MAVIHDHTYMEAAVKLGPTTYNETDTTTSNVLTLIKDITIDGTALPVNNLGFILTGEIRIDNASQILIQAEHVPFGVQKIWEFNPGFGDGSTWTDIQTAIKTQGDGSIPAPNGILWIENENTGGNWQFRIYAKSAGGVTPVGIRNFTLTVVQNPEWWVGSTGRAFELRDKEAADLGVLPFAQLGDVPLKVTITADVYSVNGAAPIYAYLSDASVLEGTPPDNLDRSFTTVGNFAQWQAQGTAGQWVTKTFTAVLPNVGDPYVVYNNVSGEATSIYFWVPSQAPTDIYGIRNVHLTIEDAPPDAPPPPIIVAVTNPAPGELAPDDILTFVVTFLGQPTTLQAIVTLPGGGTEVAWNFDHPGTGYSGSVVVVGSTRTYQITRNAGWPPGLLTLTVNGAS